MSAAQDIGANVAEGSYLCASDFAGTTQLSADVVIVGSGAGGAVVAALLAEAGQNVIVLEEGKRYTPQQYATMRPTQTMARLFRDGGLTFALGVGDTPMIQVLNGRCVGGSSVLTGGVCFRTPPSILNEWGTRLGLRELSEDAMAPHFESVEHDIHVEEVPVSMRSKSTLAFARGAEKLGHPLKPLRRNTKNCEGRSRCNFGCPHGSKLGVDVNYLPRAVAAGAQVISECKVRRVLAKGGRATGVEAFAKGPDGKKFKVLVRAKRVVVAAGGLFSPIVLQRSGIGRHSGQLGRNLTLHPGFRMMAICDERLDGWKGALQSAYSDAYEQERITMVGLFVPPGTLAGTMKGIGPAHAAKARLAPHMAVFGGMIHDQGGGYVREVMGRTAITYRMAAEDRAQMPVTLRRTAETFFAGGAKKVVIPILGTEPMDADEFRRFDLENVPARRYECGSQHPLGTCRIGTNRGNSVVNPEGESWDLEGLYVADGSVVPSSLGVNPQLTVMALAHRIGSRLAERSVA